MKRSILIIGCIIIVGLSASAQDIGSVLLPMPESVVHGLEASQKDLLIADVNDTTQVTVDKNTYGRVKRLASSSDFISLQTSDAGITQIKLLPLINDSKIICVVKTVCGPSDVCDSQIQFYTTKWMPISQADLFPTKDKEWFIKEDVDRNSQDFKNAYAALDMTPMHFMLSAADTSLTVEYGIKKYLSEEDYKKMQPYLQEESKVFEWDKISYKQ
jgi:Protein of unknown function (DUF3256).